METTLVKITDNDLENIVKQSGVEIAEGEEIKKSYSPFLAELFTIQEQAKKINFESPTDLDEKIARELRLKLVKIRTGSGELKESRKRIYLLKGNLEQAAYNLIKSTCELAENTLYNVEKAKEIKEKAMKEERKAKRVQILTALEFDFTYTDLFNMPDDQFDKLVLQLENEKSARIEEERKAKEEADRIEKIKTLHNQRKELAIPYYNFWSDFEKSLNFGEQSEDDFNKFLQRIKKSKEEDDKKQAEIKAEKERLEKEIEEKNKRDQKRNTELRPYIVFIRDYNKMLSLEETEYQKEFADIKKGAELQWESDRQEEIRKQKDKEDKERQLLIDRSNELRKERKRLADKQFDH